MDLRGGVFIAGILGALALFHGCQTTWQARSVKPSGFLGDYSQLKPVKGEGALLSYTNPRADFGKYDKIMLDPVVLLATPGSRLSKVPKDEMKALLNYWYAQTVEQVSPDFKIVNDPGPGVIRVRTALVDIEKKNLLFSTTSTVIPIGIATAAIQTIAAGTTLAAGQADIEVEILDAQTNERLAAAVDRRVGYMAVDERFFDKWGHVKDAFDYWSGRLATRLRELRQAGAPKPTSATP